MSYLTRGFIVGAFLLAGAIASVASGQLIGQPYRVDDRQLEQILKRIEQQSDKFRSRLDDALDKSRFNGTAREDDINAFVKDFYLATKNLRNRFDAHKSTSADVETVLDRAARIDGFMRRYPLTSRAQDEWSSLKTNLDELANAYNVNWRWYGVAVGSPVSDVPYRISDKEVERVIKRVEEQSDKFRSRLDSALDKSRLDGTRREDDINAFVKDFYRETKTLRDHFEHHKSTGADVESVLDRAARIDEFMRRNRIRRNADSEWAKLKVNLDELARVYNVSWRWTM